MKRPAIGKAVVLCAALSLPVLAAAPASGPVMKSARVIVQYKSGGSLMRESAMAARSGDLPRVQHAARMSQRLGLALRDGNPVAPRTQVVHAQGISSADLVARLQADPDVEFAEVDVRVRRADVPSDPLYGSQGGGSSPLSGQWYLRVPGGNGEVASIDAQRAWDITSGSPAIVVAVLDTGVRMDHPDLVGKLVRGYDFVSEDTPNNFATANDGDGRDADPSDPGDWVTAAEVGSKARTAKGIAVGTARRPHHLSQQPRTMQGGWPALDATCVSCRSVCWASAVVSLLMSSLACTGPPASPFLRVQVPLAQRRQTSIRQRY